MARDGPSPVSERKPDGPVTRARRARSVPDVASAAACDVTVCNNESEGTARVTRSQRALRLKRGATGAAGDMEQGGGMDQAGGVLDTKPVAEKKGRSRPARGKRALQEAEDEAGAGTEAEAEAVTSPEGTARLGKRARPTDTPPSRAKAKTKKDQYWEQLWERVWYEAGSVILGKLVVLSAGVVPAIRCGKYLLEAGLVSGDAFAEVFGGRADLLRMRKPELVKLGMSAGIQGLSTKVRVVPCLSVGYWLSLVG
jgi:hypothetical protein